MRLKAPFPWFGGKSIVTDTVVPKLAGSQLYVEPFAGSLAVYLGMPKATHEVVNDYDCLVVNAWRAISHHPNELADFLQNRPLMEVDNKWAIEQARKPTIREIVSSSPSGCDVKFAGIWLQFQSAAIGGFGKTGIAKSKPCGVFSGMRRSRLREVFNELAKRFCGAYILFGDWAACLTPAALDHTRRTVSVFLDPPYMGTEDVYSHGGGGEHTSEASIAMKVQDWCREHESIDSIKICLAGHVSDYDLPGWECVRWARNRGFATDSGKKAERHEEALFFSPSCKVDKPTQGLLF